MGLNTSLNTALSGLRATQVGIGVVSQNVANAQTTGYVRRTVSSSDTLAGRTVGTQGTNVQRLLDQIVQRQLWQESAGAAYTSTRAGSLGALDQLYGAPGSTTALDSVFSNFTKSLQALQNDPSSYVQRTAVVDGAAQLATRLNAVSEGVQALRSQSENSLQQSVTQVNDLLNALTGINTQISGAPADTARASLQDKRDLILSELSQYVDIRTTEDPNGGITVATGSGVQLFDGKPTVRFGFDGRTKLGPESAWNSDPALRTVGTITMTDAAGNSTDAIANKVFRSGQIAADLELRDTTLVQAQGQLDEIAAHLAEALAGGPTDTPVFVDGAGNIPYAGGAQKTGFAGRITVNPLILNDRSLLIGPAGTAAGDATRPKALLEALTQTNRTFAPLGLDGSTTTSTGTIANFVQRVVASQGQAVEAAKRLDQGQQVAFAAVQNRFQDTSKVNVDQEMSTLIELQTAYAANARVMTTVKDLLDVLMRI